MRFSDEGVAVVGPLEEQGVRDAWPKVEPYLSEALARDGFKMTTDDLLSDVANGMMGLYLIQDFENGEILAAIACDSQEYPRACVFNLAVCGGKELYRWAHLLGWFEREAVRLGCDTVRISGRSGWGRVFPDYRETHRIFERKVVV